jgi:hypothetical protein
MGGFKDRNRFTDSKKNHWFRGLLRHFRGDAARSEFAQGVRATLAMSATVAAQFRILGLAIARLKAAGSKHTERRLKHDINLSAS